jgi:hypothetical protein
MERRAEDDDGSWRVTMRVRHHAEGPDAGKKKPDADQEEGRDEDDSTHCPPVAVPLPNCSAYFMLDDFNHHHQHSGTTTG